MEQAGYLILGNGGAACNGAAALRANGYTGPLTMVADVDEPAFNPMVGPYYLKGIAAWNDCFPFGKDFYTKYAITTKFGFAVTKLDAINHVVTLASNEQLNYRKCLIATGASAVIPPIKGLRETPRALPLRTASHTLKMAEALKHARKVVVLGASLIGVKLAEILRKNGAEVWLLDVAPQVMPTGAHPVSAKFLQDYFEQNGINLLLGCGIEEVIANKDKVTCITKNTVLNDADFVAVCTGIRSNLGFVDKTQVETGLGIIINRNSETNVKGLFAAGDCAQGCNLFTCCNDWLGTWQNACYQGRAAGAAMAGKMLGYACPMPQHVSPFFDWTYAQMGDVYRKGDNVRVETAGDPFTGGFSLLVYENDILVGANLFNDMRKLGIIKKALATKTGYCAKNVLLDFPQLVI